MVYVWQVVAVLILQAMAKTDIERLQVRPTPFTTFKHITPSQLLSPTSLHSPSLPPPLR
jgi:hypothetical protein